MTDKTKEASARSALKLALEALECDPFDMALNPDGHVWFRKDQAITAIREALASKSEALAEQPAIKQDLTPEQPAQPQQEPVAFYVYKPTLPRGNLGSVSDGDLPWVYDQDPSSGFNARMLVMPITSPPASKPWVGLTPAEVHDIWCYNHTPQEVCDAVSAKLREKNT